MAVQPVVRPPRLVAALIDTWLSTALADSLARSSGGVSFTVVDRHRLIALLAGTGEANEVCREALHHGATFTITAAALPASHFVPIYMQREQHCRREGIGTLGFDQAVERLQAAQDQPLRLGWVHTTEPPYYFQLFLVDDLSSVLSCIGIGQAHQEPGDDPVTDPTV